MGSFSDFYMTEDAIVESSMSQVHRYLEDDDRSFGMVSAFRSSLPKDVNMKRHSELKEGVRKMGYGFIEVRGGYRENEGGFGYEMSLLVPYIRREDLVRLGRTYGQDTVLYKDDKGCYYVGTNDSTGTGRVVERFGKHLGRKNFSMSFEDVKDFFSQLHKGSGRPGRGEGGRKFVFLPLGGPRTSNDGDDDKERHDHRKFSPGEVWETESGMWGAKDASGNVEYFDDRADADRHAKGDLGSFRIQEREEWSFAKAVSRRGGSPGWMTVYESRRRP